MGIEGQAAGQSQEELEVGSSTVLYCTAIKCGSECPSLSLILSLSLSLNLNLNLNLSLSLRSLPWSGRKNDDVDRLLTLTTLRPIQDTTKPPAGLEFSLSGTCALSCSLSSGRSGFSTCVGRSFSSQSNTVL